jgi:hypothetical protein
MVLYSSGAPTQVIPRPVGNKRAFTKTAVTTSAAWQTLVELTPTKDKTFDLAYFAAGCTEDVWIRLKWNGTVITPVIPVMGKTYPQFWVPSEYQKVTGDGSKKFVLEVMQISASGTAYGEIVGEEV